ncbi:MAG: Do family serine endopeptidase [Methylococcales bacterium]|nr:Do family serine endopeptidase [Methylococcales bacterium]MBT7409158.1 Do family serine endopeptidase [Methylococcales bacterium]
MNCFIVCSVMILPFQSGQAGSLPDFTSVVKKHGAAVVNISTKQHKKKSKTQFKLPQGMDIPEFPKDSPLGDLFKHFFHGEPGKQGSPNRRPQKSLGSGFVISDDGYIITNYHVVNDADEIIVRFTDRGEFEAKVIGFDKRSDIALLKIEAKGLPIIKLGSSKDLEVGEWVLAIGSPFGFDHSVTAGIVSAKGRSLPSDNYVPFIQTDVAINPGNSGGPLFNLDGEVVGVNAQIYSKIGGGGYMGLSFAIPIDVAMDVVKQLKTQGHVTRGWLGVLIQDVTRELAVTYGLSQPNGAVIAKVMENSPAAKAGLKVEDVIVSYNNNPVKNSSMLPPLVGITPVDSVVPVKVLRDGKYQVVNVLIGVLPSEKELKMGKTTPEVKNNSRLGMMVTNPSNEEREKLGIAVKNGVVVSKLSKDSIAGMAGIESGDVILKINGIAIKGVEHFSELLEKLPAEKYIRVFIQRKGRPTFIAMKMPK